MSGTTTNLSIQEIASNQTQKEVTANTAFDSLDRALTDEYAIDCTTGGTITPTASAVILAYSLKLTGTLASAATVIVPNNKRPYRLYHAGSAHTATVKVTGQTGVTLNPGDIMLVYCNGIDIVIAQNAVTGLATVDSPDFTTDYELSGAHGEQWVSGQSTELVTLNTGATTTDSSGNLLPANSVIESVAARVTTTITAAATMWEVGDASVANRFISNDSTLTSGETQVGLNHVDQTGTSGPKQTSAAKVRITTDANPGAGAIRITVFYRQFVAPTS